MGSSLVNGLLANHWQAEKIFICEQHLPRRNWLNSEFPQCQIVASYDSPIPPNSIIILAVKPQDMRTVCQQIAASTFAADTLFVSIAAGVPTTVIRKWLGKQTNIVRCMPNTPAAIGHGISGLYAGENISVDNKKCAQEILSGAGKIIWVQNETLLDAVTAISGSGPAYLFYFMECLQESGKALGLSAQDSYAFTLQTMAGAALLAQEQNQSFQELRANVTSKGGTTEQAINCLENNDFKHVIDTAVQAAARRATEISNSFNNEDEE